MKLSYWVEGNSRKTIVLEGNNARELAGVIKDPPSNMMDELSEDFDIHELALYMFIAMSANVLETIEKTDNVETPKTYTIGA